jgi:hypothetical protein
MNRTSTKPFLLAVSAFIAIVAGFAVFWANRVVPPATAAAETAEPPTSALTSAPPTASPITSAPSAPSEPDNPYEIGGVLLCIASADTTPPEIRGARDFTSLIGSAIAYRADIIVIDNTDPSPRLFVDSSAVDIHQVGVYPVTYTAIDSAGNTSSVTINVRIVRVTLEDLHEAADETLRRLRVFDRECPIERARLIHRYLRVNMTYERAIGPSGENDDFFLYNTLRNMRGNCVATQRVSELLLTRAGIENTRIRNDEDTHSWNLIKIDGIWYHYDATWFNDCTYTGSHMFTNETAERISPNRNNRYIFDSALYPPIAD